MSIEVFSCRGHDFGGIRLCLGFGIDSSEREMWVRSVQCAGDMSSRVCGAEVNRKAKVGQGNSDGCRNGCFSNTAFAHSEDHAVLMA